MKRSTMQRIEGYRSTQQPDRTALGRERQYTSRIARAVKLLMTELDPLDQGQPETVEQVIAILVDAIESEA